jgi:two-component system LytT family response regulator
MATSQLRAILIDDEKSSLQSLSYELKAYCPDVEVVAAIKDPVEGLAYLGNTTPDVLFLDIEMPGMNAFELLQQIPEIDFDVIFVTAYDPFAIKAFDFNASDYLL